MLPRDIVPTLHMLMNNFVVPPEKVGDLSRLLTQEPQLRVEAAKEFNMDPMTLMEFVRAHVGAGGFA